MSSSYHTSSYASRFSLDRPFFGVTYDNATTVALDPNSTEPWGDDNITYISDDDSSSEMSTAEAVFVVVSLSAIMMLTIIGNILVIMSIFTYRPLKNVQNMFIVSLAVADITVAVFVMPFNVANSVIGKWIFGLHICKAWLTFDVLCCTASILNLCAIALDRYWAIHDPINYAQKRTLKRVLYMIFGVWIISVIISAPPLIGWNDWPDDFNETSPCKLTEEPGYVVYSSCGSFYIPLCIMTTVYIKIYLATRRRLRERAKATAQLPMRLQSMGGSISTPPPSSAPEYSATENEELPTKAVPSDSDKQSDTASCANGKEDAVFAENNTSPTDADGKGGSEKSKMPDGKNGKKDGPHPTTVKQYLEERQRISLSRERRAARILGIVMGVFVLCWLPFFLMYVIVPFCTTCSPSDRMINFITWLGYVNSALNPVIYTAFNNDFRRAFQRILFRTSRRGR